MSPKDIPIHKAGERVHVLRQGMEVLAFLYLGENPSNEKYHEMWNVLGYIAARMTIACKMNRNEAIDYFKTLLQFQLDNLTRVKEDEDTGADLGDEKSE